MYLRLPFRPEQGWVYRTVGTVSLAAGGWTPPPAQRPDLPELPGVLQPQLLGRRPGPSITIRLVCPADEVLQQEGADRTDVVLPTAIGPSGRRYLASPRRWLGGVTRDRRSSEATVEFVGMEEPVVELEWRFQVLSELEKATEFRLTDIPLPSLVGGTAPARPGREPAPAPAPPATGIVTFQVLLDGRPAPPGRLSVGLAVRRGAGWGPIRWREVRVGAEGRVRIADVAPGRYRVLRRYGPAPAGGSWRNEESVVTVVAGKETPLPPLTWVPGR